ncbi:hypothetical protein L7F22_060186 [Adiantum nelumboides]|nr:hypothetical protein [Adiantum nelumboides]
MASEEESLIYSPTWVIASTCGFFIISSLVLERAVYFIGHLLVKHKLISLESAFEKVKEELMMVGFISIALTLGQNGFAKICVPTKVFTSMLLCKKPHNDTMIEEAMTLAIRGLQETETTQTTHSTVCKEDHTPFMPPERLHQLHILLFLLVITHVVYTLIIVALGMLSIRHWKAWEDRALAKEELSVTDDVRLTRETTFMRARALNRWKTNMFTSYLVAFFQQFHNVVHEIDYHTLRYGFIMSHMPNNPRFSFYKYIRRSFQDDFKYVVGVRFIHFISTPEMLERVNIIEDELIQLEQSIMLDSVILPMQTTPKGSC